jgi:hypothetical protein
VGVRRRGTCAAAVLVTLASVLAAPSAALAQSATSPFSPGLPASQGSTLTATAPTTVTASGTSSSNSGLSGSGVIVIAVGALIVLTGISFFIWRDARRRAPVRHRAVRATAGDGSATRSGAKQRVKPRKLSPAERRRRKRGRAR